MQNCKMQNAECRMQNAELRIKSRCIADKKASVILSEREESQTVSPNYISIILTFQLSTLNFQLKKIPFSPIKRKTEKSLTFSASIRL
jgi:hypothetical protein